MVNEEAENYKTKGNDALKARNFQEAVNLYNKAIQLDDSNHLYYSNRSAAWAEMCKWENSLNDAIKCIERNSKFVKGYSRKGQALEQLGRKAEARTAYQEGLIIDPNNVPCKNGINNLNTVPAGATGGIGGMANKAIDQVKNFFNNNSKMKVYMFALGAYLLYKNYFVGGGGSSGSPAEVPLGRQFAFVGGRNRISYTLKGTQGPGVLLLHQPGLSYESEFATLADKLSDNMRVLAIDLPCNGFSDCFEMNLNTVLEKVAGVWNFPNPQVITSGAAARYLDDISPSRVVLVNPEAPYPAEATSWDDVLKFLPKRPTTTMARDASRFLAEQNRVEKDISQKIHDLEYPHLWLSDDSEPEAKTGRLVGPIKGKFGLVEDQEALKMIITFMKPASAASGDQNASGHSIAEDEAEQHPINEL